MPDCEKPQLKTEYEIEFTISQSDETSTYFVLHNDQAFPFRSLHLAAAYIKKTAEIELRRTPNND